MRNALASHNLIAVSAASRESALNAWQTLDLGLLCGLSDGLSLVPQRDPQTGVVGFEEPAAAPRAINLARGGLSFERAQPHHFALVLAYGLGQVLSAPIGVGYRHTLTPLPGDLDALRGLPSFTCAQRYGGVLKRRFASCFVGKLSALFARGEWCRLSATLACAGRCEGNLTEDELTASRSATELVLTAAVEGATGPERLDSIHRVRAELASGEWHEVAPLAASADSPARLTIVPPGGSGTCAYRVLYAARETAAWMAFPPPLAESPLHISRLELTLGGRWDGSQVLGGRTLGAELRRLEWTLDNHLELSATAGSSEWAGLALRGQREQRLTLSRDMRGGCLQHELEGEETMCVSLTAEGAEFAPGQPYRLEIVWPQVVLLSCSPGAAGQRLTEEAVCLPLEAEGIPSVIARVTNAQAAYAGG